jgi:hypothetical protein
VPFLRGEAMAVTEWDLVEYGRRQQDYRRKRRYPIYKAVCWEGDSLTLEEVIENATKYYPDLALKTVTARKWTERGLLPTPDVHHRGGAEGNRAHYPVDAAAQMATAAAMMELGYKQKEIAQAREWVLNGIPLSPEMSKALAAFAGPNPPEDLGLPNDLEGYSLGDRVAAACAGAWTEAAIGPEARKMLRCLQTYARLLAAARGGRHVYWRIIEVKKVQIRPDRLEYIVSIPGAYLDPRHGAIEWLMAGHAELLKCYPIEQ